MSAIVEGVLWRRTRGATLALATVLLAACLDSPGDGGDGGDGGHPTGQLLANPDFEEDVGSWTFDGSVDIDTTDELGLPPSEAGPHVASFGGADNQMDQMVQELVVPDFAHQLELSGVRCYTTAEGSVMAYDTFTIAIEPVDGAEGEVLLEDDNLDATSGGCEWLPFQRTSADYAGRSIRIIIDGVTDCGSPSWFAIDGLALTAIR